MSINKLKFLFGTILFWFGLGVLVHDYAHALWQVGGYSEILSLQGGYIGIVLAVLSWLILNINYLREGKEYCLKFLRK